MALVPSDNEETPRAVVLLEGLILIGAVIVGTGVGILLKGRK